ncbi:AraC family transcriptional regulator [Colwellia sp. D2M02]|uniref:helix-turn-helix domain-containing protein n=1 Tax=Colwellia sp. D2M02 TaxID=2841562 RepID=UPI001C09E3FA|nr:helix-turn-helix domain-containing protein [Colwellia sp. D2M02]MBU2893190.1 AraC family transcriptional regulator [Colwellia sp. D2M02]
MNDQQQILALTEAVNGLLQQSDLPATLTIEQCASLLTMSMTSFRRKLSLEGSSFKLIQQKYLNELCVQALLTQNAKIESLAIQLGYSERATFERAFRQKFGITPSQFRELSLIGDNKNNPQNLAGIAQNMPPLSDCCQQLLKERDNHNLDIDKVVAIVAEDPIFSGRVIGLASKAIYGKTPQSLYEAISRNLGINTVINLAIMYTVKDALQAHVTPDIIEPYTEAFLIAPKLFQLLRKSVAAEIKFDIALTEQVLVFALLGILLLSHKEVGNHKFVMHSLQGMDDLHSLNQHINTSMNISIYSASSLMLSLWHIDASLIKQLTHLDKVSQQRSKGTKEDEMILFMLSCLYHMAAGHQDYSALAQKAELLNIVDFDDIKRTLMG